MPIMGPIYAAMESAGYCRHSALLVVSMFILALTWPFHLICAFSMPGALYTSDSSWSHLPHRHRSTGSVIKISKTLHKLLPNSKSSPNVLSTDSRLPSFLFQTQLSRCESQHFKVQAKHASFTQEVQKPTSYQDQFQFPLNTSFPSIPSFQHNQANAKLLFTGDRSVI